MSSLIPKVLINCHYHHPEKPLWHSQHQSVYWTDIPNGPLFRCQPRFDGYEQIYLGEPVGGFTIQVDGGLLLLKTNGTIERWNKGKVSTVVEEISDARGSRFNDAIADPEGRVFSGTMATEYSPGRFYRIDTNGSVHELFQNIRVPSGMGFSPDHKKFYLTDSEQRTIFSCDYDRATGHLSNQYPLIKTPVGEGVPDGLTVDAAGYIWSARWNGSAVYCYSPDGEEKACVQMPTSKVSCVAFAQKDYKTLLISSAREEQFIGLDNVAGDLFHLQLDALGKPDCLSRVGLG